MGVVDRATGENGTGQRGLKRRKIAKGPEAEAELVTKGLGRAKRPEDAGGLKKPEPGGMGEPEPGELDKAGRTEEPELGGTGELMPALVLLSSLSDYWQALTFFAAWFSRCFSFLNHLALFRGFSSSSSPSSLVAAIASLISWSSPQSSSVAFPSYLPASCLPAKS